MTKRIQIPLELYELMVSYICDHYSSGVVGRRKTHFQGSVSY